MSPDEQKELLRKTIGSLVDQIDELQTQLKLKCDSNIDNVMIDVNNKMKNHVDEYQKIKNAYIDEFNKHVAKIFDKMSENVSELINEQLESSNNDASLEKIISENLSFEFICKEAPVEFHKEKFLIGDQLFGASFKWKNELRILCKDLNFITIKYVKEFKLKTGELREHAIAFFPDLQLICFAYRKKIKIFNFKTGAFVRNLNYRASKLLELSNGKLLALSKNQKEMCIWELKTLQYKLHKLCGSIDSVIVLNENTLVVGVVYKGDTNIETWVLDGLSFISRTVILKRIYPLICLRKISVDCIAAIDEKGFCVFDRNGTIIKRIDGDYFYFENLEYLGDDLLITTFRNTDERFYSQIYNYKTGTLVKDIQETKYLSLLPFGFLITDKKDANESENEEDYSDYDYSESDEEEKGEDYSDYANSESDEKEKEDNDSFENSSDDLIKMKVIKEGIEEEDRDNEDIVDDEEISHNINKEFNFKLYSRDEKHNFLSLLNTKHFLKGRLFGIKKLKDDIYAFISGNNGNSFLRIFECKFENGRYDENNAQKYNSIKKIFESDLNSTLNAGVNVFKDEIEKKINTQIETLEKLRNFGFKTLKDYKEDITGLYKVNSDQYMNMADPNLSTIETLLGHKQQYFETDYFVTFNKESFKFYSFRNRANFHLNQHVWNLMSLYFEPSNSKCVLKVPVAINSDTRLDRGEKLETFFKVSKDKYACLMNRDFKIFDFNADGKCVHVIKSVPSDCNKFVLVNEKFFVASFIKKNEIGVWNLEKNNSFHKIETDNPVINFSYLDNGLLAMAECVDKIWYSVSFWRVKKDTFEKVSKIKKVDSRDIKVLLGLPGGILVTSSPVHVKLWNSESLVLVKSYKKNGIEINNVFDLNNQILIIQSKREVIIWNYMGDGTATFINTGIINRVEVTHDGCFLVCSDSEEYKFYNMNGYHYLCELSRPKRYQSDNAF